MVKKKVAIINIILTIVLLFSFIIKLNAQQIQFAKNYSFGLKNAAHAFVQLSDSGFIIVGESDLNTPKYNGLLIRTDKNGDTTWVKRCTWADKFYDIKQLNDSAIIVTGVRNPITVWVFSITGDSLWSKSYDTTSLGNYSLTITPTPDKGYILRNAATNYGFIKIDSAFNEQWHAYENIFWGSSFIYPDIGGGYIAAGEGGFYSKPYTVQRRDSAGGIIWNYDHGYMPGNTTDFFPTGMVLLPDSNYLFSCNGYDWDIMKINRNTGDTMWTKKYSFPYYGIDEVYYYTADKFIISKDAKIYLIDTNADTIWSKSVPFIPAGVTDLHRTSDGGFAYCGGTMAGASTSIIFVKCDSLGNTVFTSVFNPVDNLQPLTFYPNPANNEISINLGSMGSEKDLQFGLCDLQGRSVLEQLYQISQSIDISTLPEGLYIATLKGKKKELRGKVMVQR